MKKITDPDFVYIPAANTDIVKRFRAMGWTPPSELRAPRFELVEANERTIALIKGPQ